MTTVRRRSARPTTKTTDKVAEPRQDIIAEAGARILEGSLQIPKNLKMMMFAFSDAGKTVFSSGIPIREWPKDDAGNLLPKYGTVLDDVLFCDADSGLMSVHTLGAVVQHVYPVTGRLVSTEQMERIPAEAKKVGVSRVVIDTISMFQQSLLNPRMQSDYSLKLQDWGYIRNVFAKMCASLDNMGIDLLLTAHADEREDETLPKILRENPVTHKVELVHPTRMLPAIQGAFRHLVYGYFDVVAFYRLEWDKDTPVRRLYTRSTRSIAARSRLAILPPVIENPDWPTIKNMWLEGRAKLVETLKAQNPRLEVD